MNTPLTTISIFAQVGKSKQKTLYTFLKSDFVRIENNELILKSDSRKIKLEIDELKSCLYQMNDLVDIPSAIAPSDEVLSEHKKNYESSLKSMPLNTLNDILRKTFTNPNLGTQYMPPTPTRNSNHDTGPR